jgi:hypothetical protein
VKRSRPSIGRSLAVCVLLLAVCRPIAFASSSVRIVKRKQLLNIEIGGRLFTTYHFADNFIVPAVRPFFWPVLAADGTPVTIDQAQHPPLHPYQRSIWIGHGDVNGADHWKFSARPFPPKQRHLKFDFVRRDSFQEELIWESAAGLPMLRETRTVRFTAYPDGARGIDITLRLSPVAGDVDFANQGDHGLLSARPDPAIAHQPVFTSSRGTSECSDPSAWCDETGKIGDGMYGIAIFDDPRNPRHPPMWHAGKDSRLATDIFVIPDAKLKNLPGNAGDFPVRMGTTAVFHYEIVVHAGNASSAGVAAKYAQFSLQP